MFGIGGSEIIVILIVALLFLGPDKLPDAAKTISKGIRDLKKQSRLLQNQIESDEQIGGAIRDLKSALRGDELPVRPPVRREPPKLAEASEEPAAHSGGHDEPRDDGEHSAGEALPPETPVHAAPVEAAAYTPPAEGESAASAAAAAVAAARTKAAQTPAGGAPKASLPPPRPKTPIPSLAKPPAPAPKQTPPVPAPTLPATAGERDPESPPVDADELGHLIKPAAGTVAKKHG